MSNKSPLNDVELYDKAHELGNAIDKILLECQPEDRVPILMWAARGYDLTRRGLAIPRGLFAHTLRFVNEQKVTFSQ